jgi:ketosteroid isomerase-like protein
MLYTTKWDNRTVVRDRWRQILLEAANLIERGGHCKDVLDDGHGRHCVLGAIYVTQDGGRHTREGSDLRATYDAISHLQDLVGANIPAWNNHPDRTAAEVIRTLRTCALAEP